MFKKGFTLIELLIVVAIIAILAAIAVPNFLEAQTRSKVTRTMADMRSVLMAMEAYHVDNNNYPTFEDPYYVDWLMVKPDTNHYIGEKLTTPLAYITAVPFDNFNTTRLNAKNVPNPRKELTEYPYWVNILATNDKISNFESWSRSMHNSLGDKFPEHPEIVMESCGPSLHWWHTESGSHNPLSYIYDPTNGTISIGMISLSNKGWIAPSQR